MDMMNGNQRRPPFNVTLDSTRIDGIIGFNLTMNNNTPDLYVGQSSQSFDVEVTSNDQAATDLVKTLPIGQEVVVSVDFDDDVTVRFQANIVAAEIAGDRCSFTARSV